MTLPTTSFAISGHAWRDWPPETLLRTLAERLDIHYLDYWRWNRGDLEISRFRELLARWSVGISVVNVPGSAGRLGSPGQTVQAQEALLAGIDEAVALGAGYVQFYTGVPERPEFLTDVKTLARDLRSALERAQEHGIILLLENNVDQRMEDHQGLNPSRRPEMVLATLEEVGSPQLRLAYDPCNFHAAGYEAYPYAYDLLKSWIDNIHLKDCTQFSPLLHQGAPNHDHLFVDVLGGDFLPVPVGQGALNWTGVLQRLERDGYVGWITLDPFTSPAVLLDWCEHSLQYLRQDGRLATEVHVSP
jgi:sugar phosphate isomerase/epimerase